MHNCTLHKRKGVKFNIKNCELAVDYIQPVSQALSSYSVMSYAIENCSNAAN